MNTDGSFSEDVGKKVQLKNSRSDSRNAVVADRTGNDRKELKMDIVALQRVQVSMNYSA